MAIIEDVVMMSLSDLEKMKETNYLMQSPVNAQRLLEAIDEVEAVILEQNFSRFREKDSA